MYLLIEVKAHLFINFAICSNIGGLEEYYSK